MKVNLKDQRFGKLTVVGDITANSIEDLVTCLCDCGNEKVVKYARLRYNNIKSCGCLAKEVLLARNHSHGMTGTRQYFVWVEMKQRCSNPNSTAWDSYGGRGITYDTKWHNFIGFWEDMSEGYQDDLTLDRTDTNGNYCKDNCRWVDSYTQARNKRKLRRNSSGVTGVSKEVGRSSVRYRARWVDLGGVPRSKSFSVANYGEELGFFLACEYRQAQIDLMNLLGAGYSEDHGR